MYGTGRFWQTAALGAALAGVAALVAHPAPLVGAAGVGAWLLAAQVSALGTFRRSADLEVGYAAETRHVAVERRLRCRLVVERPEPAPGAVEVTAPVPLAAQGADRSTRTVRLDAGETRAATTFEVAFPVAGRFAFDPPTVRLSGSLGLFGETVAADGAPTVDVVPRGARDLHVGRGGDRIAGAYGEHTTSQHGAGLQPIELREYEPGEPADSIDWKATARLNQPYVREHEAETDRETVLVVDHRASMDVGRHGETMLAYAREVALSIAATATSLSDPLGLYAVGDEGLTARRPPSTSPRDYEQVHERLRDLEPTPPAATREATGEAIGAPARARVAASRLAGDDSRFAARTRPFLAATDAYVEQLTGDPLFGAVRSACSAGTAEQWTVIVTSDRDSRELRQAVRLAAARSASVLVFLTPQVLFDDASPDLDAAYDRYVAFEDLRRELDRLPRVSAFEVGPGDRIDRLLERRRTRTTGT